MCTYVTHRLTIDLLVGVELHVDRLIFNELSVWVYLYIYIFFQHQLSGACCEFIVITFLNRINKECKQVFCFIIISKYCARSIKNIFNTLFYEQKQKVYVYNFFVDPTLFKK